MGGGSSLVFDTLLLAKDTTDILIGAQEPINCRPKFGLLNVHVLKTPEVFAEKPTLNYVNKCHLCTLVFLSLGFNFLLLHSVAFNSWR